MTEWTKTLMFVVAAGVSVGLAAATTTLSRPSAAKAFERVGEEFYPEFEDPTLARSLQVVSYDEGTSVIKNFDVTWGKEGWAISPHGYPADAADQLEKTAASVIGITRTGLASRREGDWERYGVIDPLSEDATKLTGRGSRVTLKDEKGQALADYILGKPVEGREGYYYVRTPKEDETYIAKVDLNLSTRFSDWIESDLLKLSASDLKQVEILKYSVDVDRGTMSPPERSLLLRGEEFGPWKLEGLNEATEQVNTAEVNKVTRVLDELKITGVRPKPQGLNPDLSLDPKVIDNQLSAQLLRESLQGKGFFLARGEDDKLQLVAKEGQLIATTKDGVAYDVYFGEQFTGSQFDLEFGEAKDANKPKQLKQGDSKASEKGRYVLITARFEPSSLGEAPKEPAAPQPPAEGASDEEKKKAEEAAKKAKEDFEAASKGYDQKVADAKKRVDELNDRFQRWYYVISAENFQDLRLSREALVQPKAESKPAAGAPAPGTPAPGTPESETPAAETPPAESSATETPAAPMPETEPSAPEGEAGQTEAAPPESEGTGESPAAETAPADGATEEPAPTPEEPAADASGAAAGGAETPPE